jgi:Glycosyltransferase family 17
MTTRYDCTMFFNENDLYEIRLNQHWDFIDKFIVVEAGETFTGLKKTFNFDLERFEKYKDKIIYRTFDNFKDAMAAHPELCDDWCMNDKTGGPDSMHDHFQYNYMYHVLKEVGAQDRDPIYFSCCDEIVKPEAFEACRQMLEETPVVEGQRRPLFMFHYWLYVYKVNLLCQHWSQHVSGGMTEFGNFHKLLPATIRGQYLSDFNVPDGGWEFTFLDPADGETALAKHRSWGHSRDIYPGKKTKFEFTQKEESVERLFDDYKPTKVDIAYGTHPDYIVDNLDKLQNLIYKE